MDMLKAMSETLRIGLVVSDMFVPGCPLAYLNEGFAAQTGTYVRIRLIRDHSPSVSTAYTSTRRLVGKVLPKRYLTTEAHAYISPNSACTLEIALLVADPERRNPPTLLCFIYHLQDTARRTSGVTPSSFRAP